MVNVYGDFSETGYNNPYYVKPADTRGQADYQNTTGRSNRDRVNLGTNYGEAGQYYNQQQQAQAQQQPQQQQPQSSPVTVVVPQQPRGDAYDMATEAARRGDAIDPAVLQKAREQGFTGTVTPNLIVPGAANRLANTRNLANMSATNADGTGWTTGSISATSGVNPTQGTSTTIIALNLAGMGLMMIGGLGLIYSFAGFGGRSDMTGIVVGSVMAILSGALLLLVTYATLSPLITLVGG